MDIDIKIKEYNVTLKDGSFSLRKENRNILIDKNIPENIRKRIGEYLLVYLKDTVDNYNDFEIILKSLDILGVLNNCSLVNENNTLPISRFLYLKNKFKISGNLSIEEQNEFFNLIKNMYFSKMSIILKDIQLSELIEKISNKNFTELLLSADLDNKEHILLNVIQDLSINRRIEIIVSENNIYNNISKNKNLIRKLYSGISMLDTRIDIKKHIKYMWLSLDDRQKNELCQYNIEFLKYNIDIIDIEILKTFKNNASKINRVTKNDNNFTELLIDRLNQI